MRHNAYPPDTLALFDGGGIHQEAEWYCLHTFLLPQNCVQHLRRGPSAARVPVGARDKVT